jgi:hypothetical protein
MHKDHTVSIVPAAIGVLLWGSATALLLEDAYHAHRYDVATMATPILTAATVAAAVMAHRRLARFRLLGGLGFAALALLGSLVMATGTLGRLAETKEGKVADTQRVNRDYGFRIDELKQAKAEQVRECKSFGKKCEAWNSRVDLLTTQLAGIAVKATEPKAEAIGRLATLLGGNGDRIKEIVAATDPVLLPLFLEAGSVLFFAAGFTRRKVAIVNTQETLSPVSDERLLQTYTREQALADLRQLRTTHSQRFLSARWQVSEATVSRWLAAWASEGAISRERAGKDMRAIATVPANRRLAPPKG